MKRRLASLIALAMVGTIALTSCSSGSGSTTPAPANTDSVQTEGKDYGGLKYLRMCSGTQGATWTTVGSAMMGVCWFRREGYGRERLQRTRRLRGQLPCRGQRRV